MTEVSGPRKFAVVRDEILKVIPLSEESLRTEIGSLLSAEEHRYREDCKSFEGTPPGRNPYASPEAPLLAAAEYTMDSWNQLGGAINAALPQVPFENLDDWQRSVVRIFTANESLPK